MSRIDLMISVVPEKQVATPVEEKQKKPSIESQVRDSIQLIESDRESVVEWRAIKLLYRDLCKMKQTPRVKALCDMIRPVLNKYGFTE